MSDGLYEILALAARYFFAGLFLLIVFRAWRVTVRDSRRARKLRRWAPQTGLSGELVVLEGDGRARRGMRYPVIREGTLGSGRAADIRVRHASVRSRHARFELTEEGLALTAVSEAKLRDGEGKRVRKLLLRDGDNFYAGSVLLSLVLIDASGRAGDYEGQDGGLFDAPRVETARPAQAAFADSQDAAFEEDAERWGRPIPTREERDGGLFERAQREARRPASVRRERAGDLPDAAPGETLRPQRPAPARAERENSPRPRREGVSRKRRAAPQGRKRADDEAFFFDTGDDADEDNF